MISATDLTTNGCAGHSSGSLMLIVPNPLVSFTVPYAVIRGAFDVTQRVAMHPKPVDTGVSGVAVVALDSELEYIVSHGVRDATDALSLRVFNREVLNRGAVGVVHVIAEEMGLRV